MLTRSMLVLVYVSFRKYTAVLTLTYCQNFMSAQCLGNILMEFDPENGEHLGVPILEILFYSALYLVPGFTCKQHA